MLCEKPATVSAAEMEAIIRTAQAERRIFAEAVMNFYSPVTDRLRAELAQDSVVSARLDYSQRSSKLDRLLLRLALLPVVVSISYEFNRLVGRHDNWLTHILTAPGMWMQRFTTNEPDDSMIEVAIEALTMVIPTQEGADRW